MYTTFDLELQKTDNIIKTLCHTITGHIIFFTIFETTIINNLCKTKSHTQFETLTYVLNMVVIFLVDRF